MALYLDIDHTHDIAQKSWVSSANAPDTEFPIQNLPLGVFSTEEGKTHVGVAIGDQVLDLVTAHDMGLLGNAIPRDLLATDSLNSLFAAGHTTGIALRHAVFALLNDADPRDAARHGAELLHPQANVVMHRPTRVGNYTDFYAGIHHAVRAGSLLQPENPLPDNYKWVPIGYHGRASTVKVSGMAVRRPSGQLMAAQGNGTPGFGPCRELDLELEMAVYLGKPSAWGETIAIAEAGEHIAGYGLLNDWSARDIQRWEMKPLGPFLAKNFGTTVSPWVLTPYALAPFRVPMAPRDAEDPQPLPYLHSAQDQAAGTFDIALEVKLRTRRMLSAGEDAVTIITSNMRHLYWTPQQLLTHHASSGCQMEAGDLIGTGTISGPVDDQLGSLLELTVNGQQPVRLPNGEMRSYLEDGDEVTLKGFCRREGFAPIGFGDCSGVVAAAS